MTHRWVLVLMMLAGLCLTGCEVSVGNGNFDGGFDFGDGDSGDGDGDSGDGDSGDGDSGDGDDDDAGVPGDGDSGDGDSGDGDSGDGDTGDGDTGDGDGGDSVSMLAAQMADAICRAREACVGVERLEADLFGNACAPQTKAVLADGLLANLQLSVDAGQVAYDASALDTCLTDIRALGCDWQATRWPTSCDAALGGTVPDGEACNGHFDCAGDAYCDYGALPTCPGTCVARVGDAAGCTSDAGCLNGLLCAQGVCVMPGVAGDTCDHFGEGNAEAAAPCAPGFECFRESSASDTVTVCKAVEDVYTGQEGDDCDPFVGELCEQDLSKDLDLACMMGSGKCERGQLSNEACDRGKPDPCPAEQYCNEVDGACRLRETAGRSCSPSRSKMCAEGRVCLNDECVALSRVGQGCEEDAGCWSGNCNATTGTCEPAVVCE